MSPPCRPALTWTPCPTYVPGRTVPGAIKLASNEVPYGPLPGVVEAITAAAAGSPTATRTWASSRCATRWPTRLGVDRGPDRHRLRLGRAGRAPGPGHLPRRRRGRLLVALVRGVPDHRGDQRRDQRPGAQHAPTTATTCRRWRPRSPTGPGWSWSATPTTRPARDAHAPSWTRSSTPCPADVLVVLDEAYREFVTDPDVPDGLDALRRPAQRGRAAHPVQGVGPGRPAGRLPGRRSPSVAAAVRKVITPFSTIGAGPGRGAGRAGGRRRDAAPGDAGRGRTRAGRGRALRKRVRPDVPPTQANFVWLPLRRPGHRVRRRVRGRGRHRAAVRRRRRAGHDRHPGGERRLPRLRP